MNEREVWQTASVMMKRYGRDAGVEAAFRADELGSQGDRDGQRAWIRIGRAIAALANMMPEGALH